MSRDIVLLEGSNELNVQLTPIPPPVAIVSFNNPKCYVGAAAEFEAVVYTAEPSVAFQIYIAEADLPSYAAADLTILSATGLSGSPNNLYTLSNKFPLVYRWRGPVNGWATRYIRLPVGNYPVRGKITSDTLTLSDEIIATLVVTDISDSQFVYSDISCKTYLVWPRYHASFSGIVTNGGSTTRTATIILWEYDIGRASWYQAATYDITLAPGQSYTCRASLRVAAGISIKWYLIDDLGGKSATCVCYS